MAIDPRLKYADLQSILREHKGDRHEPIDRKLAICNGDEVVTNIDIVSLHR